MDEPELLETLHPAGGPLMFWQKRSSAAATDALVAALYLSAGVLLTAIVGEARGNASPRLAADATASGSTSTACSTCPEALDPQLHRVTTVWRAGERR